MNKEHKIPEIVLGVMLTVAAFAIYAVLGWVPRWWKTVVIDPRGASDFYTMIAAVANITLAGFAFWQIRRSVASDHAAERRFEAERRPWVSVDLREVSISRDREHVMLYLSAQNVGNMPAVDVEMRVEFTFGNLAGIFPSPDRLQPFVAAMKGTRRNKFDYQLISPGNSSVVSSYERIESVAEKNAVLVRFAILYKCSDGRSAIYCTAGEIVFRPRSLTDDVELEEFEQLEDGDYRFNPIFDAIEKPTFRLLHAD